MPIDPETQARIELILEGEGMVASAITIIVVNLGIIIALLAAPEPVISKGVAVLLSLGVGILAVTAILLLIFKSREEILEVLG